jgi:hypothetical protein
MAGYKEDDSWINGRRWRDIRKRMAKSKEKDGKI